MRNWRTYRGLDPASAHFATALTVCVFLVALGIVMVLVSDTIEATARFARFLDIAAKPREVTIVLSSGRPLLFTAGEASTPMEWEVGLSATAVPPTIDRDGIDSILYLFPPAKSYRFSNIGVPYATVAISTDASGRVLDVYHFVPDVVSHVVLSDSTSMVLEIPATTWPNLSDDTPVSIVL